MFNPSLHQSESPLPRQNYISFYLFSNTLTRKRPSTSTNPKVKRLRVQPAQLLHKPTPKLPPSSRQQPVRSVFEQAVGVAQQPTKIGVKLADTISAIFEAGPQIMMLPENKGG